MFVSVSTKIGGKETENGRTFSRKCASSQSRGGSGDVQTRPWNKAVETELSSSSAAREKRGSYPTPSNGVQKKNKIVAILMLLMILGTFALHSTTTVDQGSKYQWSKTAAADDLDVHLSKCVDSRRKKLLSKADDENAPVSSCIHSKHRAMYTIELDDSGRPSKDFFIKQSTASESNLNLHAHYVWGICTEPPAISWAKLSKRKAAITSCNIELAKSDHDDN